MKKIYLPLAAGLAGVLLFAAFNRSADKHGFVLGTPEVKSMTSLAFGPDGILFIGDSKNASVVAFNTKDIKQAKTASVDIKNIDQKVAAALGTQVANISILDMAVNPISKKVYFAVQNSDGTPVLLRLNGDKFESVPLKDVNYSTVALNNSPAEDAKDQRGNTLRVGMISDIGYSDGKLLVSGISNLQFASTFRSITFPFTDKQEQSSLEIYHGAHGRYETASPIKTFTTSVLNGKKYLIASYTCTPLVLFPLEDLKTGTHVKGQTVAEMGAGNTPVDMLTIKKGNEQYLVMANTSRPVSEVNYKNIAAFQGTITEKVATTAGVPFKSLSFDKVLQMDKIDDGSVLVMQRKANGDVDLWTANGDTL